MFASPRVRAAALVLLAAVMAALPEWREAWYQDDQLPVVFRVLHTDLAHHHGVIFPRVAPELGFGYGRMLHQFYPPLGVELAAWLHALGLGYLDATRATYSLCLLASAAGMYLFALTVLRQTPGATLAGLAYVWSPYVLLDAHRGGVLGESLSLALIPWTLLALHRLGVRGGWTGVGAVALGIAAVTLAHNITALVFVGLGLAYAALIALREAGAPGPSATRRLATAVGAIGLGLALAAFYWVPALLELEYSNLEAQRTGSFSIGRYLGSPRDLLQSSLLYDYHAEAVPRYGLVVGLLAVGAVALYLAALTRRRDLDHHQPERAPVLGFAVAFLVCLVMQLEAALPIWEGLPLISFLQFPQRLFVFAAFAGAVAVGTLPWSISTLMTGAGQPLRTGRRAAPAILAGLAIGLTSLPGVWFPPPSAASHRLSEDQVGLGTVAERRLTERSAYDDYFPAWVEESATQVPRPPSANAAEAYRAANDVPVPRVRVLERGYLSWRLETDASTASSIVFHTFYFPGWRATVDGDEVAVEPVSPLGLPLLAVPPGSHRITFELVRTPIRLAAELVSVLGLVGVVAVFVCSVGARATAIGVAAVVLALLLPWLGHLAASPIRRPAPTIVDRAVTPHARLIAVELSNAPIAPGGAVQATLIWQATDHTAADLQSGLRIERFDGGRPIAERWSRPARETTPTGKWVVGELVPDPVSLRVPPDTPPGRYLLAAGLRDRSGAHTTPIGEIEVR